MSGRRGSKPRAARIVSKSKRAEEAEREHGLERLVFGRAANEAGTGAAIGEATAVGAGASAGAGRASSKKGKRPGKRPRPSAAWVDEDDDAVAVSLAGTNRLRKLRTDEEDDVVDGAEYQRRLRSRLVEGQSSTDWAALPEDRRRAGSGSGSDSDDDGDDATGLGAGAGGATRSEGLRRRLERSTAPVTVGSGALPSGRVSIRRVRDANAKETAKGVVSALQFHPTGALLMAASMDNRIRFFEADGSRNRKVAAVHFPDMPVMDARLSGDGMMAFAVGRRPHYYTYDIPSATATRVPRLEGRADASLESFAVSPQPGASLLAFLVKDGDIVLASTATRQPVGVVRASAPARAAAFTADGRSLVSSGDDGMVHVWDLRMQRLRGRFVDEGMQATSSLALAPGGEALAVGSDAGIVNVYDWSAVDRCLPENTHSISATSSSRSQAPAAAAAAAAGVAERETAAGPAASSISRAATLAPSKVLTQLSTRISDVVYNHDGSILAMASHTLRDKLRLVHASSMTVFGNWPTARTPLHFVNSLAFSPTGDRLAIGNDRGRVLLLKLDHFAQA
ncbi:hypothetical protein FNF27_03407 [Cafeteria roenbergensis]|uniref:Uncharacterized protein n=1 Tax=Cafeteria roenbergensis TaxID=33653 RepID=A0A5A8EC59_CAFRO|nr:hypothetical protein FNF27_03407 [Cafeteria roenbergensis]